MTVLKHIIGKSTLSEGIAVPRALENWINAPAVGCKRNIVLRFSDNKVIATLRRIANGKGHVQIKYESSKGTIFREWLSTVFSVSASGLSGEYLELHRVSDDEYQVVAYPVAMHAVNRLIVTDWVMHRTTRKGIEKFGPIREIPAVIQSVVFEPMAGQDYYNKSLSRVFCDWDWESEIRVIPDLALKSDFLKEGVQVEVEFGNARTYYQDYIKFMLANRHKVARIGVLLVPTETFARALCEIGRRKAVARGRHSYSGMIHLEKVRRELPHLACMLKMPFVVGGIGRYGE